MSIIQAMLAGTSALNKYGDAMTVIGNNLANAQTTGFKTSRSTFEDMLVQTIGVSGSGSSTQVGTGVGLSSVDQSFQQGSLNTTARVTDMAIDGRGYFIVRDAGLQPGKVTVAASSKQDEKIYYSRAGSFQKDKNGYLVNNSSMIVQGWLLDKDGNRVNPSPKGVTDVNLAKTQAGDNITIHLGNPTGMARIAANLDSSVAYDATSAQLNYDKGHTSTIRVYDSQGGSHNVEVHFERSGNTDEDKNRWKFSVIVNESEIDPKSIGTSEDNFSTPPSDLSIGTGKLMIRDAGYLVFDDSGSLVDVLGKDKTSRITNSPSYSSDIAFTFNFMTDGGNPATPDGGQKIKFNFGNPSYTPKVDGKDMKPVGGSGRDGVIQSVGDYQALPQFQDGYGVGTLEDISVNQDGKLYGSYSNGQTIPLYQISVADFSDEQGLDQVGASLYRATSASGDDIGGIAQTGRLGGVRSFVLEQSNVDMSGEFVNMIAMQRAFQANSRIVSVTDGMLEELMSLKR
ncbi:MAG: flagellar hook protein FlgE [Magnetococcales bacterium]|nr:flagellar hook protein FlgE [Magnetococcales bacterium]